MIETNKIYNKDCITYMKTLPNECIDLIKGVESSSKEQLAGIEGTVHNFVSIR